jgi:hypothetical protein
MHQQQIPRWSDNIVDDWGKDEEEERTQDQDKPAVMNWMT